jgi:hypothetical protein
MWLIAEPELARMAPSIEIKAFAAAKGVVDVAPQTRRAVGRMGGPADLPAYAPT